VRGRIRCNERRLGAVPYVGQTPPLEIHWDPQQTFAKPLNVKGVISVIERTLAK